MNTQGKKLMGRTLLLGFCGIAAGFYATMASAGIEGSVHDFSAPGNTWANGEICIVCHTPHNASTDPGAPLWNHDITTTTYTLYDSSTLNATVAQPSGPSKLCLSCHDGTVAIDSFGGRTGTAFVSAARNIGEGVIDGGGPGVNTGDLSNDHPISFTYDAALVTADGALFDPTTSVTIGDGAVTKTGSIAEVMLYDNMVQCASCHDVHDKFTDPASPLLKISNAGSGLCLTCHDK